MSKKVERQPKAARPAINPRAMMEKAIAVMRQSIGEPRKDDKTSPVVGAVIVKLDGTVETASRGELRHGDHAEYTLLERKNRANKLDGAILFATLEPCAPGARRAPKVACAERIVQARIRKVWVGIEDPDPTVDRKGIKYLQDNGVEVAMFDRDLQDIIREENKSFFAQASERNAADKANRKTKSITLSDLENAIPVITPENLSTDALEKYRDVSKIKDAVSSKEFQDRLLHQGLLKQAGGERNPTGFGLLLFGAEPRNVLPQAGLLGSITYPNGKQETRDFDGPIVLIPELVEKWLSDKLPSTIDRGQMRRQQKSDVPFELVREAVVNALVHRDYSIAGAKCQLIITEDTITIKSPGHPIEPITLQQLQEFNAPMLSRNPQLHYVFARMELAEERGLGMKSFKSRSQEAGLPIPKYTYEDPYLTLTLYRTPKAALNVLPSDVLGSLSKGERAGWEFLASKTTATMSTYAGHMAIDRRTAQRQLKRFVELGLLVRTGSGPATKYAVRNIQPVEKAVSLSAQPKTRFQQFKEFVDKKIAQAQEIKASITPANRAAQIQTTKEWIETVAKAIHTAFGGKERNDFVNYDPFTPQLFHGVTMGGLEKSIDSHVATLERLKKNKTAADLLPDFDPADLRDFE